MLNYSNVIMLVKKDHRIKQHTVHPPPSVSMSQYTCAVVEVFQVLTSYTTWSSFGLDVADQNSQPLENSFYEMV